MTPPAIATPQHLRRSAILFLAIGLLIFATLYWGSERLTYRTGHANALYKIATLAPGPVDWVILGASHAMPLDFDGFNDHMQQETGLRIVNLASPGTGPLYNRFVLEHFLATHRAGNLLYVVDSFAFDARDWNEDRFADNKLLARTPFDIDTAERLTWYCLHQGVDPLALLDYVTGFSKLNNRDRFDRDVWVGETQFERNYRTSVTAERQRIAYLYPGGTPATAVQDRYLAQFDAIIELARHYGMRVVAIKLPVPARFRAQLPGETQFDARLSQLLARRGMPLYDLSAMLDKPGLYLDTDHLNRAGVTALFDQSLKQILEGARSE
ncbi:MAG TPA: hypothetical protein VMB34_25650 [Acetobacteraceae bacterium]|nr:hypothetical protein [Acetobacteraceae bacterium]